MFVRREKVWKEGGLYGEKEKPNKHFLHSNCLRNAQHIKSASIQRVHS